MSFDFNTSIKKKVDNLRDINTAGWYRYIPELNIYEKIANVVDYAFYSHNKLFINTKLDTMENVTLNPTSLSTSINTKLGNIEGEHHYSSGNCKLNNAQVIDMNGVENKRNIYLAIPYSTSIKSVCPNMWITWVCSANHNALAIYQISYS